MRRDEVDGSPGTASVAIERLRGRAQSGRQGGGRRRSAPEVAHGIAELVVPFGPPRREAAHLIATGSAIPRLGDQLHAVENGILADRLEEAALFIEPAGLARQDGAEIEPEAV